MRKLAFLFLLSVGTLLVTPNESYAQPDSTCQIFGDGGSTNIPKYSTKRFYTKYVPGAVYNWTVTYGNISITGPRNLHYVDVYGIECGPAQLCVSYSIDGQAPCCVCVTVNVTGCSPPPGCCQIFYINSTMQFPYIKVKFQTGCTGMTMAKLFQVNGTNLTLIDTDTWPSGYNPAYTYNLDINYNLRPFGCGEIFCLRICGYRPDGTECCTGNFAIQTVCDGGGNFTGVIDVSYPGCNAGGGGGGGLDPLKAVQQKSKLAMSPNPVSNALVVTLPEKNKITRLWIMDRNGNVLKTVQVKGGGSITILAGDLKAGSYFIKTDDPMVEAATFIKL